MPIVCTSIPHLSSNLLVELEKDGCEQVGMLSCQGAQNIGLSNHKLKSTLKVHCVVTYEILDN